MATPQILLKIASILYGLSVPGHMLFGFQKAHPAINTIQHKVGRRTAQNCFNYVGASLAVAALLNWQWARTGGPKTNEEWGIFWIMVGAGFLHGFRYWQVGEYAPLGCLWVGSICGVVATFMQ